MVDVGIVAVFVSEIIQGGNQPADTSSIFLVLVIVCRIQIHRLGLAVFFSEMIGKQGSDMTFDFQDILQKQFTQNLIKAVQSNNILKSGAIFVLLCGRVFERRFISAD